MRLLIEPASLSDSPNGALPTSRPHAGPDSRPSGSSPARRYLTGGARFLDAEHSPARTGDEDLSEHHLDGNLAGPFLLGKLRAAVFFQSIDTVRGRDRRVNGIDVGVSKIRYGHADQLR